MAQKIFDCFHFLFGIETCSRFDNPSRHDTQMMTRGKVFAMRRCRKKFFLLFFGRNYFQAFLKNNRMLLRIPIESLFDYICPLLSS